MIKSLKIQWNKSKTNMKDFDFVFHSDINIFTGKSGSGKSLLLRILHRLNHHKQILYGDIPFKEINYNDEAEQLTCECKTILYKEWTTFLREPYETDGAYKERMFSWLLSDVEYSIILIDDIENNLHPDIQQKLLRDFQKTGNQFFITTNSPFIYSAWTDKEFRLD